METSNLYEILAGTELDPSIGIKVARLSGDDAFSFFGAEITAGTKLNAHYHREGIEIYYVLSGTGRMSIGHRVNVPGVAWKQEFDVHAGDCFTIQAGEVHQLHNTGDMMMNVLFGCPTSHLTTDRTIIGGSR